MHPVVFVIMALFLSTFISPVWGASCNALDLDSTHISIPENQSTKTVSLFLVNDSDEDFDVDDVKISANSPFFDVGVKKIPKTVDSGETEKIQLTFNTADVNGDKSDTFQLSVKGEYDDNDACSFSDLSFTIHVTIEDGADACTLITVESTDVSLVENTTVQHSITIRNDSNEKFTLQGFSIFDDSSAFTVNLDPSFNSADFEKEIPANTTQSYSTEIKSFKVNEDTDDTAFIEVRGTFAGGIDCSFSEISNEFDVRVEDTGTNAGFCSDVSINAPPLYLNANEVTTHLLTIQNGSSQSFFVDELSVSDKNYNIEFSILQTPEKISSESSGDALLESTVYDTQETFDGNAFLTLKGHFSNNGSCFVPSKKIPFYVNASAAGACDNTYIGLDATTIVKGNNDLSILLNNPSSVPVTVHFSIEKGTISPAQIILPSNTAVTQLLHINSQTAAPILNVTTQATGCFSDEKKSTILFSGIENAPVKITNAPTFLKLEKEEQFVIELENKSSFSQETKVVLTSKPANQQFTYDTTLGGYDKTLIYLPTTILFGQTGGLLQVTSAGYTLTQFITVENGTPLIIETATAKEITPTSYAVEAIVSNNSNQPVTGTIGVTLPSGWSMEGNSSYTLESQSQKVISFKILTNGPLDTDYHLVLTSLENGTISTGETHALALKATQNPIARATAFATKGNAPWIGLFFVLLLVGAWYMTKNTRQESGDDTTASRIIHSPHTNPHSTEKEPPSNGNSLSEEEDEPWMNPRA